MGLRVSELVALKFTDIEEGYLNIQRMEIKTQDSLEGKQYYKVVDYTKTREKDNRYLYLCLDIFTILDKIIKRRYKGKYTVDDMGLIDDYIFYSQGSRANARAINFGLEKLCRQANIPPKSSHKIRKTVASRLNANNVPLDEIRKILGHTNISTTLSYLYNPQNSDKTNQMIEQALSGKQVCTPCKRDDNGSKIINFSELILGTNSKKVKLKT